MSNVRKLAENIGKGSSTEWGAQKAQALAILDLADAVRQAGREVSVSLDNIGASIAELAEAVQRLDWHGFLTSSRSLGQCSERRCQKVKPKVENGRWWQGVVEQLLCDGDYLIGFIGTEDVAEALGTSKEEAAKIPGPMMLAITKRFFYAFRHDDHAWGLLAKAARAILD